MLKPDFCIIGGGAAGIPLALSLAKLNQSVVLVEKERLGGDCVHHGCIPSKALIAAARSWHQYSTIPCFSAQKTSPMQIWADAIESVNQTKAKIGHHYNQDHLRTHGIELVFGSGHFMDSHTYRLDPISIQAGKFVIATGTRPHIPSIPGVESITYYTNETIFTLDRLPKTLTVIGGGATGLEFAQSFQRLGCKVTLVQSSLILAKDDPEMVKYLRNALKGEGLTILEHAKTVQVNPASEGGIHLTILQGEKELQITTEVLLFATGRAPNIEDLHLEKAQIDFTSKGIAVNANFLTSNPRVYAIGDVIGKYQLAHAAFQEGQAIIRHALYKTPVQFDHFHLPWVTYTDPEFTHVGYTEAQAKEKNLSYLTFYCPFHTVARGIIDQVPEGSLKVLATKQGKILGITFVGRQAGDLLGPWLLALKENIPLQRLHKVIFPYPTLSEIHQKIAHKFYLEQIEMRWYRKAFRHLLRFLKTLSK